MSACLAIAITFSRPSQMDPNSLVALFVDTSTLYEYQSSRPAGTKQFFAPAAARSLVCGLLGLPRLNQMSSESNEFCDLYSTYGICTMFRSLRNQSLLHSKMSSNINLETI